MQKKRRLISSHHDAMTRDEIRKVRDAHYATLQQGSDSADYVKPEAEPEADPQRPVSELDKLRAEYRAISDKPPNARWSAKTLRDRIEDLTKEAAEQEAADREADE